MTNWLGKQIGKYQIKELLGQGGMGAVYKAYQPALERHVAIKLIHTHLTNEPDAVDRFRREAKVVATLRHPGIVQIYDFDVEDDAFYMVMEFVPGQTLRQRLEAIDLEDKHMPFEEALGLFHLITQAVAYAHNQGIIHRDLKPDNVLLTEQGQPVLADFGLSKMLSDKHLTAQGVIMGTPHYMSPEQGSNGPVDTRSDVYALGVILYELTTGMLPFNSETPVGIILKHISDPPAPPRSINPMLPKTVENIIQKALAKAPAERYNSAEELLSAIGRLKLPSGTDTPVLETALSLADDGRCPYRGLQTFEAEHAEFFFGREAPISQLVEQVINLSQSSRENSVGSFLAVLGASGSGKSSLVRAGLVPTLHREGALLGSNQWITLVMKPGNHPLEELAAQLALVLESKETRLTASRQLLDNFNVDGRALNLAVRLAWSEAPPEQQLFLVVDQFEEVFTLCQDEVERQRFIENLLYAAATGRDGRVIVILTMRADFYHRCAAYRDLARRISAQQVLVGPMNEIELRRAIERPARQVGLRFEPGLVDTILADVARQPGALPLLQHALLELWERRQSGTLTLPAYRDSGGVAEAIAQRAEALYTGFNPNEQAIVRRVMLRLTQPGEGTEDTRRRVAKRELLLDNEQAELVDSVIQRLADTRLVTTTRDTSSGEEQVDVAHEALIRGWERLRGWLDEDRTGLIVHRRLTEAGEEWSKSDYDPSYLYGGTRLTEASAWARDHFAELNTLEREFLYLSALYDGIPEVISWGEVFASKDQLAHLTEALQSGKLSTGARREAILSLTEWASHQDKEQQKRVAAILGDIASIDDSQDIRLLALEKMLLLRGTEAISNWWKAKQEILGTEGVRLLAHLWDRGARVIPTGREAQWRMLGILLQNRWQQRKAYIIRWISYGAIGSAFTTLVVSMFYNVGLASNLAGVILVSTLSGFGMSFGLSWGELFEGWLRVAVRILGSIAVVAFSAALLSLVISIAYQVPAIWSPRAMSSMFTYTLAVGLGTGLSTFLPKYVGLGHLILGGLTLLLTQNFIIWSPTSVIISLGVIIGTGIARNWKR